MCTIGRRATVNSFIPGLSIHLLAVEKGWEAWKKGQVNPSCNFIARFSEETDGSSVYIREGGRCGRKG